MPHHVFWRLWGNLQGGALAPPLPVILWGTVSQDLKASAVQKGRSTGPYSPTASDGRLEAKGF